MILGDLLDPSHAIRGVFPTNVHSILVMTKTKMSSSCVFLQLPT